MAATVTRLEERQEPRPRLRNEDIANGARMALLDYLLKGGIIALPPETESQLQALCANQASFETMRAALGTEEGCETATELLFHVSRLALLR